MAITVKVSREGQPTVIRRSSSRDAALRDAARAERDFKGTGALITVQGRGSHRDIGDFIWNESA
jgi:hypothetical protein